MRCLRRKLARQCFEYVLLSVADESGAAGQRHDHVDGVIVGSTGKR